MIIHLGKITLDIDVEKTREFYLHASTVTKGCSCDGCRNFEQAAGRLPAPVREFFDRLGVDPQKVCECYVNGANPDGSLLYGGFCHVCGRLLEGESAWQEVADANSFWNDEKALALTPDFTVSFQ